ncbi:hypothetical protein BKI52_15185 [marine bacterium AO1-C]|nr:hypothetical protein BKI52_15185 [marine bacterium AO1-C]
MFSGNEEVKRPAKVLFWSEIGRASVGLGAYFMSLPMLQLMPQGDNHPVLVIPGFMSTDRTTSPLRFYLKSRNYVPYRWQLGRNLANFYEIEEKVYERLLELKSKHGRKVSIVGWSLGGVYAREIARRHPDAVRQVITLGSPFGGITGDNNIEWLYELATGRKVTEVDHIPKDVLESIPKPTPVPTTAIYSKSDGVVAWQHCMEKEEGPITENVEVFGSHIGLGHNPAVLACIAERLSQPEEKWKRFNQTTFGKLFYSKYF